MDAITQLMSAAAWIFSAIVVLFAVGAAIYFRWIRSGNMKGR